MVNNIDPDLKFVFENPSKSLNFLDVNIQIVENNLVFDTHYKPTNSFTYLTYPSCHQPHTKNNISLSLAKRTVRYQKDYRYQNKENKLDFFLARTAFIITMVILKNVYLFLSNPKTNCWLCTIDAFLVVTIKMFYMYLFAITVTFSILDKLKN